MKFNAQEIRAAMDSRLSFIQESGARRARIRQAVHTDGNPRRKRPINGRVALAAALAVIVTGAALAAGLNLFDADGRNDARNAQGAPEPVVIDRWVFAAEQEPGGDAAARITSVYYDSDSLIVTYLIENGTWFDAYTPTREQLAAMTRIEPGTLAIVDDGAGEPPVRQYLDAVQNGTSAGLMITTLVADDNTIISPGVDLGAADKVSGETIDGKARTVRQYAVSLPDREYLNVEISLWKNIAYLYFDGTDTYMTNAQPEAFGDMVSMVWHTESEVETRRMTGKSMLMDGTLVQAEAEVSATYGKVTLTAYGAGFAPPDARDLYAITNPEYPYDNAQELIGECWYRLFVDGSGTSLAVESTAYTDARTITATFAGTGRLPDILTVLPILESTSFGINITPEIILKPVEDPVYVATWEELNAAAEAGAKDVIVTADITFGEDDHTIVFHNAVTLRAEGMHYTIDGGAKQILRVHSSNAYKPLTGETVIRNLVFMNGQNTDESSDAYGAGYGGAVFVQGPLRMENCAIQNSQASGGALCVSDGDLVLVDSWLVNNAASGLRILNGTAAVIGCKIAECHGQKGGGVYGENANIIIVNSRILRCVSEADGGGIYLSGGELSLSGCTLEGNIAQGSGGAVYLESGTLELDDQTVITDNTPDDIVQP